MKNDLGLRFYKIVIEPLLFGDQKIKGKKFANGVRTNFRKEDTMRIFLSDEKFFNINGVYNSQNDRVWAIGRDDADKNGDIRQRQRFPQEIVVRLAAFSKVVTPLVIFDQGTVDHTVYIEKVVPIASKYGNQVFGSDWIFNGMVLDLTRII